jgi:hypothetical protein
MRQFSKRDLYAMGEPLGDCATRAKPFGRTMGGGGSSGGSSSSADTVNNDKRVVVGEGGAGVSGDNSSITINSVDSKIVDRALASVDSQSAITGDNFSKLLDVSKELVTSTQASVAGAYTQATTDAKGSLDNKTIVILGVAGAFAWAYAKGKK